MAAAVIPIAIAAASAIAGAAGNKSNSNTTTTYQLTPELQSLLSSLTSKAQGLTTPSLTGYQAQQTQDINKNAGLQEQAVNNTMAARGLATSPVAGTAQSQIEAQRFGTINNMNEGLPLLNNQLDIQNLGAASNIASIYPKGGENVSNVIQGGGVGGAAGGLGSILAYLYSSGAFKPSN